MAPKPRTPKPPPEPMPTSPFTLLSGHENLGQNVHAVVCGNTVGLTAYHGDAKAAEITINPVSTSVTFPLPDGRQLTIARPGTRSPVLILAAKSGRIIREETIDE